MFKYLSNRITNETGEIPVAEETLFVTGERLNGLPAILAGPILRDTTTERVSVWIALRTEHKLTLNIYSPTGQVLATSAVTPLRRLGENLYVGVVTATAATPLQSGLIYTYNVYFSDATLQNQKDLTSPGILSAADSNASGIETVVYPGSGLTLPSFALVPPQLEDVRIMHTSCRKPHGPGDDAFGGEGSNLVEAVINNALPTATELARPHLLFLTGDQIYADDVAAQLLFMIDDASKALLGSVETLSYPSKMQIDRNMPITELLNVPLPHEIGPDQRQELIYSGEKVKKSEPTPAIGPDAATSGLTSQEAHNHLMRLGEFYAMYLFAWSDVLWGEFADVQEAWRLVMRREWPTPPATIDLTTATDTAKAEYREKVKFYKKDRKKASEFEEKYASLKGFKDALEGTRRLLANVPTYMICDDHEITDDWYFSLKWCQQVLGDEQQLLNGTTPGLGGRVPIEANPLGKRIVANGTAAYIAFQDWGNRPLLYATSGNVYNDVLELLGKVDTLGNKVFDPTLLEEQVLPKLRIITPSQDNTSGLQDIKALVSDLRFDYILDQHGPIRVLFLDSRTKRGFDASKDTVDPQLISAHMIDEVFDQLPAGITSKTTIVIAPGPIMGHNAVDFGQEIITSSPADSNRDGMLDQSIKWDREAWVFNEKLFLKVLSRLSLYSSVVVLSGDVHYAFSNYIRLWNETNVTNLATRAGENRGTVAQLVASACRNLSTSIKGFSRRLSPLATQLHQRGIWDTSAAYYRIVPGTTSNPAIVYTEFINEYESGNLRAPNRVIAHHPPALRYEMQQVQDTRSPQEKGYTQAAAGSTSPVPQLEAAAHHRLVAQLGFGHTVTVGFNNVGSVRFQAGNVVHELWHRRYGVLGIAASSNTRHVIPLAAPTINDLRPGDPPLN